MLSNSWTGVTSALFSNIRAFWRHSEANARVQAGIAADWPLLSLVKQKRELCQNVIIIFYNVLFANTVLSKEQMLDYSIVHKMDPWNPAKQPTIKIINLQNWTAGGQTGKQC